MSLRGESGFSQGLKRGCQSFRRPYGTHLHFPILPGAERAGLLSTAPTGLTRLTTCPSQNQGVDKS
jgi:hypothetical protein